jgi:hypothetical protein
MGSASITELDLGSIITARLQAAVEMRQNIGLPSESTTVYRLVNRCDTPYSLLLP